MASLIFTSKRPLILFVIFLIMLGGFGYGLLDQPRRVRQAFAGDMYHQRYSQADELLLRPSSVSLTPLGDLMVTDKMDKETVVAQNKLPFLVSGMLAHPYDLSMTALQDNENGVLLTPALSIYLSVDGGQLVIESCQPSDVPPPEMAGPAI